MLAEAGAASRLMRAIAPGRVAPVFSPDRPLRPSRRPAWSASAVAWRADDGGHVAVVVGLRPASPGDRWHAARPPGGGGAAAGWDCPVLHAHGPAGFYRARSSWAVPVEVIRTARTRTGPAS